MDEGVARPSALGRFLREPMWVLGLVLLMDETDKNIVRGLIHPLQRHFGVSADELRERFDFYFDKFDVRPE